MSFALCAPIANAALPRAPTERLATFTSNKKQNHSSGPLEKAPTTCRSGFIRSGVGAAGGKLTMSNSQRFTAR